MEPNEPEQPASIALDEYTNHFLAEYPVHCQLRTVPLGQRLLHSHNGYEFYLCLQGSGSYIVGDRLYPLHPGTLTVISPHVIHRPYVSPNHELHRYVVSIDESYLEPIQVACRSSELSLGKLLTDADCGSSHFFLTVQQHSQLEVLFAELEHALHTRRVSNELTVLKNITDLFILILRLREDPDSMTAVKSENEQIIAGVLSYLIEHYQETFYIDDLLPLFPVSRSRLFQLFREITGNTIKQFLTEYRLNIAKQMLLQTDLPVTEVASTNGFGDMSHFFHVFKKETGLTPKQYRKQGEKARPVTSRSTID
ncbi:MAG: AraC family transcriptional regulator [Gorillibacterium sp.]|nr:AraC family transcriptional regulator [Gorillibacterium sp.]